MSRFPESRSPITGDSFELARDAAGRPEAEFIVFCGVHFMAESADILTAPDQKVILPDLAAGCSMADMAALRQVEDAWEACDGRRRRRRRPGDLHELQRRHQGVLRPQRRRGVHLSNAEMALEWAFASSGRTRRCSSSPTSTSAATPPSSRWGCSLDDCVVWDPHRRTAA